MLILWNGCEYYVDKSCMGIQKPQKIQTNQSISQYYFPFQSARLVIQSRERNIGKREKKTKGKKHKKKISK